LPSKWWPCIQYAICRKYTIVQHERIAEIAKFAKNEIWRHNQKLVYPETMADLPHFEQWVSNVIKNAMLTSEDVVSINMPPSDLTTNYHSMYVFGNHLWVASVKKHFSTVDLGVVATFEQECCYHSNDPNPTTTHYRFINQSKKRILSFSTTITITKVGYGSLT